MDGKNQSWAVEEAVGGMNEDNRIYEAEKNGWGGGGMLQIPAQDYRPY